MPNPDVGKYMCKGRKTVNNRVICHPLFLFIATISVYESYLKHISVARNSVADILLSRLCIQLAQVDLEIFNLLQYCDAWAWKSVDPVSRINRNLAMERITVQLSELMTINEFASFPRTVEDDNFFEELIKNMNYNILKLQSDSAAAEFKKKNEWSRELALLKINFQDNLAGIRQLESQLNMALENEILDKVKNYIKSDIINNEKMTPRFLSIAKSINPGNMESITDMQGNCFPGRAERAEHIVNFYEQLYKLPADAPHDLAGSVEQFLGPEICSHPAVVAMKLTQVERDRLDRPFSFEELDNALALSNKSSAPGIDGVSNSMINKIWHLVRSPLMRYAVCCFRKGTLTDSFKTACIRIIPKKGNTKSIKNWRPISLLSCYYKLLSRVINVRLGTVIDKVTNRCQKAYNIKRHIHEVCINLDNNIRYCADNNISGVVISIDQTKAFDSIYNEYCNDAYRFFGFGESFIDMMNTLGCNRTARVILEDGSLSRDFNLERGRPQGDSPSPRQYNIGEQILLLKLEFNPLIEGIGLVQPQQRPLESCFNKMICNEDTLGTEGKVDAFADDSNVTCLQKFSCLAAIRDNLVEFGRISGLNCNLEKTNVMFIGPINQLEAAQLPRLGFTFTENIKVLGFNFSSAGIQIESAYDDLQTKVSAQINKWSRFNISLAGRIAISKTFLISQLTYHGAIVIPGTVKLNIIQQLINNYVLRGMPLAKDRLYIHPNNGGLGLICIKHLLGALQCSWFKRIFQDGVIDTWRLLLMKRCFFYINCFRTWQVDRDSEPVLYGICNNFWEFCKK